MKRGNSRAVSVVNGTCGVATWKLLLVVVLAIGATAIGGIALQSSQSQPKQMDVDLGFDFPAEETAPKTEG